MSDKLEGYTSPCAAHYYRERFDAMDVARLTEQRKLLEDGLKAITEERAELAEMTGAQAAKLRGDLERDAAMLRAKLAAVEELLEERRGDEKG